jgi:hypothetical protein
MTTKDTPALALEALELASITVDNFTVQAKCQEAITAIKQAITPETGNAATPEASAITAGNGQAQEPVGVVDEGDDGLFVDLETKNGVMVKRGDLVYTHPAPKQAEPIGKQSLQVPNGYKLVPVEPTPEMINAGRICPMPTDTEWDEDEDYSAVYRAMLAAAPTPPETA